MTNKDLWNSNEHRLLCYLKLNKCKSIEYINLKKCRDTINLRISNPNKQLSLNLSEYIERCELSKKYSYFRFKRLL